MQSGRKFLTLLLLIIFLSIVIRLFSFHPSFSDENFYFNVAKNIAEGKVPYKDFFFAHPPLQVYTLAVLYKIFGSSFFIGKFLTLVSSSLSVILLYFIIKQFCKEKSAFLASILFLISPPFLAFSSMSYGMWETMLFILLSFLFLLKKRTFLSATFFVIAVLFRYIAIFYLSIFLITLYLRKEKFSKFFLILLFLVSLSTFFIFKIFGTEYVTQTILYHFYKFSNPFQVQYFSMGMFFVFLALISALIGLYRKDKFILTFSLLPLAVDLFLLMILKTVFYHYFLLSIPFYLIGFSKILELKYNFVKIAVLTLLIISLIINFKTFDFYFNPVHSKKFYHVTDIIRENTEKNDTIFGEPVMTNYVSFVTGREIAGNYLDSYVPHLVFDGTEKVVENLNKEKPKIIIEMKNYYTTLPEFGLVFKDYILIEEVEGLPKYLIYMVKS